MADMVRAHLNKTMQRVPPTPHMLEILSIEGKVGHHFGSESKHFRDLSRVALRFSPYDASKVDEATRKHDHEMQATRAEHVELPTNLLQYQRRMSWHELQEQRNWEESQISFGEEFTCVQSALLKVCPPKMKKSWKQCGSE